MKTSTAISLINHINESKLIDRNQPLNVERIS